ncbi:LuxR C-terminal-related transcriptional regulator [Nocardioides bruguierae]|uniref:LuxR C-terminal-related transcriptional regulator n=1 Tax=Nocardioides bruguierae TaxID=2945102 RepID=A0A9X2IF28_9ACTN|nr:LuxR C-terminal-related transcriptional regulator [Nocardioides bruguierae]MCL8027250.1 LuxR C-terminal-related transcriptional regulator [Nocardioides bruguierae]MCM0619959.1 LuxR C-terminal-related transcriptional regulator [Nocardioides bruguierae]
MGERIVLVEDHLLFAEAMELAISLRGHEVSRVVPTEARNLTTLVDSILRRKPVLVLLDLDLGPLGDSTDIISTLTSAGSAVVVVTGSTDEADWGRCLAAGARTVVPKSRPLPEIMGVVRRVLNHERVIDLGERERLVTVARARKDELSDAAQRLGLLSPRERVVLAQLMAGRSVADTAAAETLSQATVRTQVKSILAKLQVSSQVAAVGLAYRAGWTPGDVRSASSR